MKFRLVLAALVGAACFVSSCGGDDDPAPMEPIDETPPVRSAPESLLTSWFERAYNTQDGALYDEMLDSTFTFRFFSDDVDSFGTVLGLDVNGAWDKTNDLRSTNNMFNASTVSLVDLEITVHLNSPYSGGDCDNCRELVAGVDLHVTTNPPGEDELILDVVYDQVFIAKRDPADTTLWVLFRQIDQNPSAGKSDNGGDGERGISSNEETSWGGLKAEFF